MYCASHSDCSDKSASKGKRSRKTLLVLISFLCTGVLIFSTAATATNSYRQIELRYRSAAEIQQTLAPLIDDSLTIVADGNSLILKGPAAELNQLQATIRKMDKPRQQLQVAIYRGVDPSVLEGNADHTDKRYRDQAWSTNAGSNNRVDTVNILEGSKLTINESGLIRVPSETDTTAGKSIGSADSRSALASEQAKEKFVFRSDYQRSDSFTIEKGLTLVATLVKDSKGQTKVALKTTYALPSLLTNQKQQLRSSRQITGEIINVESSTVTLAEPGQWQLISSHQQQSHRPAINTNAKLQVSSTAKQGESDRKVWVKVSLK